MTEEISEKNLNSNVNDKNEESFSVVSNEKTTIDVEERERRKIVEYEEGEAVSNAVKQVVMHHGYRAKILRYLFTPNAIRVSLEPELGWNENIFLFVKKNFW